MSTIQLQRAILWAFLATLIALIGVTTVAWIRRPKTAPTAAAGRRRAVPVLANETDGSVYDLNLKIRELKEQLSESDARVVDQQKLLTDVQRQRRTLDRKLTDLENDLDDLRARFERSQQERTTTPPLPPPEQKSTPNAPPGGALTTPIPPAPATPP